MKKVSLMLVALMLCGSIHAVTISTAGEDHYDGYLASPDLLLGIGSDEGQFSFGDDADASLAQTFTVGAVSIDVTKIALLYENDDRWAFDAPLTMYVFAVTDSYAATIALAAPGDRLLTESFVAPYVGNTDTTLSIELDTVLSLNANTSYAVWIDSSATGDGDGNPGWEWLRSSSSAGDIYAGGGMYENGDVKGTGTGARDASLILIPEPATLTLLGVGMLGLIRKRK